MTQSKLKEVGKITKDAIETLHSSLETCPSATTEHDDPNGLLVTLLPHQRQALAWLLWREKQTPSGGILADDMGLGKTLTSIALILLDKQLGFTKKSTVSPSLRDASGTLVVCPASLVHHWKKEIDKRVKPLKITVCLYHGPTREKSADRLARYDVVLTTYSIVEREAKDLVDSSSLKKKKSDAWLTTKGPPPATDRCKRRDSPLCQVHWRRIILDEAHTIKNPKCMTSMAACCLEAESRWALTGTPIQNNTKDLYAIIKFLRCSPFDEFKVWTKWVDDKSTRGTARMNTIVRSLLLRRTKQQHLTCLPTRDSVIHNISLCNNEKEVYDLLQLYSKNMLKTYLDNKGEETRNRGIASQSYAARDDKQDTLSGKKFIFGKELHEFLDMIGILKQDINAGTILLLVLRLRQCCSHLSLLLQVPDDTECKANGIDISLEDQMMNMSIVDSSSTEDHWSPSEFKESFVSSKIHCLLQELHKLKHLSSDRKPIKSVIVSQWTRMLDVIAYHLRKHGLKYDFITGSVSLKKRSEIVEEFNSNPYGVQIMLVSLKAGGVGLNLIGGSHLFLIDQHWNPALEAQASDRIYRVGQKNDVVIHRFLCVDTIEEKIAALQEKKKALADSVLKGSKDAAKSLTLQDLRMLFGV
ncbi:transcription termination factor 2-like isoform X2 [Rhopilema esculentum]|uniref:transcription termination factor 2-like isoform X2 n=2 Tax=Rhopilema esculentum TaxID=499914 RepID=UPI0031CE0FA4